MLEGRIPYRGFYTWYREEGSTEDGKLPVLCLHGGPGGAHYYIEPLFGLAETGRRTVLYDQIGCGQSATPPKALDWTVDLFVEEVDRPVECLQIGRAHV